jgi:hypothetical protein
MMQQISTTPFTSKPTPPGIHEMSEAEKQQFTEELTIQTGEFGASMLAGVLYLGLLWIKDFLF